MDDWNHHLKKTRNKLNSISQSFCAAKWLQVTMHLQSGYTHSCHHPGVHKIPLDELNEDPSALHNTSFKKKQRKKMLEGTRPSECEYCWKVEDSAEENFSDRFIKSADHWAFPYIDKIKEMNWDENVAPTYLEVSFGNECNFKCAYCIPEVSSSIWNEYEKYGPYQISQTVNEHNYLLSEKRKPYGDGENNPYVNAFWKWLPKIIGGLHHFRVTGGEPLLNSNTFKLLNYLESNPQKDLNFSVNTNLGIPEQKYENFLSRTKSLLNGDHIKTFHLYTSADTFGKQAEYIRNGFNYNLFIKNVEKYLNFFQNQKVTIMVTFNILSLSNFKKFLNDILYFKRKYADKNGHQRVFVDISYLSFPEYLSLKVIDDDLFEKLIDIEQAMLSNRNTKTKHDGFDEHEINKVQRLIKLAIDMKNDPNSNRHRRDFYRFITEYDRRKGLSFLKNFPEMEDFYKRSKFI